MRGEGEELKNRVEDGPAPYNAQIEAVCWWTAEMSLRTNIIVLAVLATIQAAIASPATKSGELYVDATWGPEGSPYTIVDGFFVMEGAVLTILNATILCESYTCLSVRGSLVVRDSFIGKRTVTRHSDRQSTTAVQHNNAGTASSIELHNVTIRSVTIGVSMRCCHSGQRTLIQGSVIDDAGVGLSGYTGNRRDTRVENSTIMFSGTGSGSADRSFVNVLFYRNRLGSDSGRASFVGCRFIENEVGFDFNSDASLQDVLFEGNKVGIDNGCCGHRMGRMEQATLYKNDLAVRSSTGWSSGSWSGLNFVNNSVNIEYRSSTSSQLDGAYWGQCADAVTIQESIDRVFGQGGVSVSSIANAPNCHGTFPCRHVSGCCSSAPFPCPGPTSEGSKGNGIGKENATIKCQLGHADLRPLQAAAVMARAHAGQQGFHQNRRTRFTPRGKCLRVMAVRRRPCLWRSLVLFRVSRDYGCLYAMGHQFRS